MGTANEFKTRIYNSFRNGWTGETTTAQTGKGWQIVTMKRSSGLISSTAKKVDFVEEGVVSWSFGAKQIKLLSEKANCTEKKINELHLQAVEIFKTHPEYLEEAQKPVYTIEVLQRVFLDGYNKGQHDGNEIIYKIVGRTFYTVDIDTLELSTAENLRPFSEKFGIGMYFIEDDKFKGSIEELNEIVEKAKAEKTAKEERLQALQTKAREERQKKIEEGKKLVTIPEGTKSVIVADMYQDDSDSQSDYFSTSVSTTMILAFSSSEKNSMKELKKACLNFEETAGFYEGGADLEHTKGYSGYLPNYFLGSDSWIGWKVNKGGKYGSINIETEEGKNEIFLAVAEGRYFVKETQEPETEKTPNFEAVEVPEGQIQIIDYSERAIAVIGETKPIKDKLKELGGKFNFRLSCGAGWIFSKKQLADVQKLLSGGNTPEAEEVKETTLKDEIQETVNFLADLDVKIYGEVTESVRECARVQEVEIKTAPSSAQFTIFN